MPIYEFSCPKCGPFEERRIFAQAGDPARCPFCNSTARRVYTVPNLVATSGPVAAARLRDEKSAHEPEVIHRDGASKDEPTRPVMGESHVRPWQAMGCLH